MGSKVLVIEDNVENKENITEILQVAGYSVMAGSNGRHGVELALTNIPDIILCDIMMPDLDGYGVLKLLNNNPETAAIPFIFLTAKATHTETRKGMESGADDYITKPFDSRDLVNAIESRLKKKDIELSSYSKALDRITVLVTQNTGLSDLKTIINERKRRIFKKNQVIYNEGDNGNGLYLVISGKIKTIKLDQDGRELMTGILSTDDFLGTNLLFSSEPYTDTATALETSVLCYIPKELLEDTFHLHPSVASAFLKILAGDIREKEDQLLQLAYHSVRKKLAQAILRLYRQQGPESFTVNIGREDLAAMAGMATETVSRTLSDFQGEHIIEKKGSKIVILHIDKLLRMKN